MNLQCNIGSRGKFVRLASGSLGVLAGIVMSALLFFGGVEIGTLWVAPASLIGGGAFAIFEGWSGWCVVRALGIWTPI